MTYQLCWYEFVEVDKGFLWVLDACQHDKIALRYLKVYMNEDEIY